MPQQSPILFPAAVLAFCGVFFVFLSSDFVNALPPKSSLQVAEGNTTWHQKHRYGVRFTLSDHENGFDYPSKGNAADRVARAMKEGQVARVLYDPNSLRAAFYSDQEYFSVFAVEVDGRTIRSYDQVAKAWQSDNSLGFWLGGLLLVAGVGIFIYALRPGAEG